MAFKSLTTLATGFLLVAANFGSAAEVESAPENTLGKGVIVVCPPTFREALQPWVRHRQVEGMSIAIIDSASDIDSLRRNVKRTANADTNYIVLVGDVPAIGTRCDPLRQVPTSYAASKVTAAWGSTPTLLTDMPIGDLDGDKIPDAVVGRLPVDRPSQLSKLVQRIIAQDNSTDFGPWRGNVQLIGGIGGFGAFVDATIESVTRAVVTNVLPLETRTSVIYASPGHAFCPVNQPFTDAVLRRYENGSRFWVYAGHGQISELDRVPPTADGIPVLDGESVRRLNCQLGNAPIGIMLACYTGAIDAPQESLAEQMLLADGGPIAVFAGSRVTMPYGNTTAAVGLIEGVFDNKLPRLGDAWLYALKQMHRDDSTVNQLDATGASKKSNTRIMIDALASVVSPSGADLVQERREHMGLYNLLGDPTLRMHQPHTLSIRVDPAHDPGSPITVFIDSPIAGQLSLAFDKPLGGITQGDPNETTVATIQQTVTADRAVKNKVTLPIDIVGPIIVRGIVTGETAWATAASRTLVRAMPKKGQ
tara:strand:+ start:121968 stop:123572 length:1605 start_codon:yes stop_codon:yes gene_type:complete